MYLFARPLLADLVGRSAPGPPGGSPRDAVPDPVGLLVRYTVGVSPARPWPSTTRRALCGAAVARILYALIILGTGEVWRAPLLLAQQSAPPEGIDPAFAFAVPLLLVVVAVAAVAFLVGLWTRVAGVVLLAALWMVLGPLQTLGTPLHVHHLVWVGAVLAMMPTHRALAVDVWRERGSVSLATLDDEARAATHGLRCIALLLGLVYFFPGLHKWAAPLSPFADGDALARLIRLKALEGGFVPPIDPAHTTLLWASGIVVVVVELALPGLALWRPRWASLAMLGLQGAIWWMIGLPFTGLLVCGLFFWVVPPADTTSLSPRVSLIPRSSRAVIVVGCVVLLGVCWAGVMGEMRGWPFACYPTFASPPPTRINVVDVEYRAGDQWHRIPHDRLYPPTRRTSVHAAERRVRDRAGATRFLRWRRLDPAWAPYHDVTHFRLRRSEVWLDGSGRIVRHAWWSL